MYRPSSGRSRGRAPAVTQYASGALRDTVDRNPSASRTLAQPVRLAAIVGLAASALAWQTAGGAAAPSVSGTATFISVCAFSHRAPDDPIVFPRAPGFSHNHTFVGNVSTNAFSTLATLRRARTTCDPQGDTAAYWAPTLYVDGSPVIPRSAAIYYRRLTTAKVRPFPAGLRMVAGNSHAVSPQSRSVTYWDCAVFKENFYAPRETQSENAAGSSSIPHCSQYADLQLNVNFPNCWNGKSLDSADHKSHMAYSVDGRCPASHPVAVPAIRLVYSYLPPGPGTVILSSGGQYSGHADFINSWNERVLTKLVDTCLDDGVYCQSG
jgi:Domain of unknown function (DUF1996)